MQRKNKNRDSITSQSLSKNPYQPKDIRDKKKLMGRDKERSKESIRCKSQNTHRIEDNLSKKFQCKTHRLENSNVYNTLEPERNEKIQDCYKKVIDEMSLQNDKVNFNQFSIIMARMKKHLSKKMHLSEDNLAKAWKILSKTESKISEKQLSFNLSGISNLFTMSEELPKPKTKPNKPFKPTHQPTHPKHKIKKQSSNAILQKKTIKPRKISKSFVSQKQNIDTNRFYSQRHQKQPLGKQIQERPQLQVIVKIQQGIIERLVVYPDTCLSTLARQFGAKYKLPNCKIVMLRDMIESQLRRHLTQITEESADHYTSDRSALFNTLNYDEI